jgi:CBS domain-containing protein
MRLCASKRNARKGQVMPIDAAAIMTTKVIAAAPDDTVAHVARLLATNQISAVPVCDADGKVLGMLSEGDLMRPFVTDMEIRRAWWLRLLAEGTELAPEFLNYVREDQRRAKDLMTTQLISVTEATSVREIADLLIRHRIKRVPVLRAGKVVGIVSRADLVRVIASMPDALSEQL